MCVVLNAWRRKGVASSAVPLGIDRIGCGLVGTPRRMVGTT